MNKTVKMLSILLVAIMLVSVATPVFASTPADGASSILTEINDNAAMDTTDDSGLLTMASKIVGLIRTIAVIAGLILLSVIGVKFMMGSAEEKAEYKKSLIPLVVGIVVVMAAAQIMTMLFGFFD